MYLIWDFDGTLGYRTGGWSKACVDVLADTVPEVAVEDVRPHLQEGFPWQTPEEPHATSSADDWWEQLYPTFAAAFEANGVPPEHARELARRVRQTYVEEGWQLYDETLGVLSRLSAAGWTHLVLSNHVPELPSILDRLGLTAHVEELFVSAEIGYEKPHPEAFAPVRSAIGDDVTVWMIGDSYRADVEGATSVGLPAISFGGPTRTQSTTVNRSLSSNPSSTAGD